MKRMTLADWMAKRGLSDHDLAWMVAAHLGIEVFSHRTVEGWRLRRFVPRKEKLQAIKAISGGKVTADSFMGEDA